MGTNISTIRANNYFDEQKIKQNEQIIMYNEQNIKYCEQLII